MLELFQVTGSSSFAVRAALEEADADYVTVDVEPFARDEPARFGRVNPFRTVPTLRDGLAEVYEVGACLLWIAERFPEAGLAPPVGDPERGRYLRFLVWLADGFHPLWHPVLAPHLNTVEGGETDGIRRWGFEKLARVGEVLEADLAGREWCAGDRFGVADLYLYMLVGWQHYVVDYRIGGDAVQAHFARVGAREAVARTRALDDLDERLQRHHPELRAGRPMAAPVVELRPPPA
jgi:glutathione S-transferase